MPAYAGYMNFQREVYMSTDEEKKENLMEQETGKEPEGETLEEIQRRQIKQAQKRKRVWLCIILGSILIALIVFLLYQKYMEPKKRFKESVNVLKDAQTGDSVVFGTYEQDKVEMNGEEDIEWIVLDKEGDKLLLLTRYCLLGKSYNTEYTSVTWEDCSLRKWLNSTFMEAAFDSYEQDLLLAEPLVSDDNPVYGTDGGNDTEDKVFLLSNEEITRYLPGEEERKAESTPQALLDGVNMSISYGTTWWWTRTPGNVENTAMVVSPQGEISEFGHETISGAGGVRMAVWIDLSGL